MKERETVIRGSNIIAKILLLYTEYFSVRDRFRKAIASETENILQKLFVILIPDIPFFGRY